jgi:hypothetical protein
MNINDFLKKVKAPSEPVPEKKRATPKEDEAMVITKIMSASADEFVIDYNGMPFGISKKDIVDIETLEGTEKNMVYGQFVSLIVKKEGSLDCKVKMKVNDLIPC